MKNWVISIPFLLIMSFALAQEKDKLLAQSNNYIYEANSIVNDNFINAEKEYRKAISTKSSNIKGTYNLGNAYYKNELYDEALLRHIEASENANSKTEKHKIYHNIGNVLMQKKMCQEAIEAFKNALRNNPNDEETRYNLALAKDCAKNQDGGSNDKNEDEENKDEKNEENKKDEDEKKDEGNDDDNEDEGNDKEDKNKPNEEKNDKGDGQEKKKDNKPQPQQSQLSPQQVKSLLEAMNNEERKVQEKINAQKVKGEKIKNEKDW